MRISDWSSDVCSSDLGPKPLCGTQTPKVDETWIIAPFPDARSSGIAARLSRKALVSDPAMISFHSASAIASIGFGSLVKPTKLTSASRRAPPAAIASKAAATCEIGRAHVCTPVTNAQLVCRLLLQKQN